jgi:DNA-binding GntR family transcriptional regulator
MKPRKKPKRKLANEIADAIQLGEFRPGEWLRQIDLEEKLGATRFAVRAALDELVIRNAIQHVPNRGYRVAVVDDATIAANREVRIIVECAAASKIIAHVDDAAAQRLRDLAERFTRAVKEGTHVDQSRTNREFHRVLYGLCGNAVLEETIWSLRDRSRGSALTLWRSHEAMLQSDRDHHAMLGAIERRDASRLADIIADHIDRDRK